MLSRFIAVALPSRRVFVAALLASAAALYLSANANAGYAIQPADGTTTTNQPTFLVGLDSYDSRATVYVSTSPAMLRLGLPSPRTGSCTPSTPFGEPDKYTCRPSSYAPGSTSTLRAGTYYWWLTHTRAEPGGPTRLVISGPFRFVVPAPTAPTGVALVSPQDGATVRHQVKLTVHVPAGAGVRVHASTTATRTSDNRPVGVDYARCSPTDETARDYSCVLDESLPLDGRRYFWWAVIQVDGTNWVYGPWRVTLGSTSSATWRTAPSIPTAQRFTGERSIKHQRLTDVIYQTMRALEAPRVLAFACWRPGAYESVHRSIGAGDPDHGGVYTLAFWYGRQPRWLHLSPIVCEGIQKVLDNKTPPTGHTAAMFSVALHETMHAYGIGNEARANCYAAQLVPLAASKAGVNGTRAAYLGTLAVRQTRRTAPSGYWNVASCRDGGAWDLFPRAPNLK